VLDQWLGVFVPAGTPAEVVRRLNGEMEKALVDATVRERFDKAAMEAAGGTSEQFAQLVRSNFAMYGKLVADLKIRVE